MKRVEDIPVITPEMAHEINEIRAAGDMYSRILERVFYLILYNDHYLNLDSSETVEILQTLATIRDTIRTINGISAHQDDD